MTEEEKEILDGLIISDLHLRKDKKSKNASIGLCTSQYEFAQKIKDNLKSVPWSNITVTYNYDKRTLKAYKSIRLSSRILPYITEQHNRWYRDKKKIVPKDLNISKNMLMWWYLGDGHLYRKKTRPNYRRVSLSCNSMSEEERMFLIEKLREFLQEKDSITSQGGLINIGKKALCSFIQIIGKDSAVKCYQYKFDFGNYSDKNYFEKSYLDRPLIFINKYRRKYNVRELDYEIVKKEYKNG